MWFLKPYYIDCFTIINRIVIDICGFVCYTTVIKPKGAIHMTRTKLADRKLPDYTRGEEIFNMVSHIVGGGVGVVALVLCVIVAALHKSGLSPKRQMLPKKHGMLHSGNSSNTARV